MTDELFEIIKIMNNIKNHDFSVADLKICKEDAEIITMCLETPNHHLDYDENMKEPIK